MSTPPIRGASGAPIAPPAQPQLNGGSNPAPRAPDCLTSMSSECESCCCSCLEACYNYLIDFLKAALGCILSCILGEEPAPTSELPEVKQSGPIIEWISNPENQMLVEGEERQNPTQLNEFVSKWITKRASMQWTDVSRREFARDFSQLCEPLQTRMQNIYRTPKCPSNYEERALMKEYFNRISNSDALRARASIDGQFNLNAAIKLALHMILEERTPSNHFVFQILNFELPYAEDQLKLN
ncbi:MAG: hypothetical protein HYX48_04985 [Chlamydiales bacterium]|nr:hypothetical protein [Chlamydiales bacterium]